MIPSVVTAAPGVYVLPPIDNNFSLATDLSVTAATAVVMRRGEVGKPFTVTRANWQDKCGKPLPMSHGAEAEGMRHVKDALEGCDRVTLVRVIASDAKYPVIQLKPATGGGEPAGKKAQKKAQADKDMDVVTEALPYGNDVKLADGAILAVWPKDGDPSDNRRVVISNVDADKGRFSILFQEKISGEFVNIPNESFVAGLGEDDKDDENRTVYLPALLEERGSRFRAAVALNASVSSLDKVEGEFAGGTNGGKPKADDFKKAWSMLGAPQLDIDLMFAAGQYDANVIADYLHIASGKLAQFRYDIPPALTEKAAIEWIRDAQINNYLCQGYHYPYRANDEWFGGKSIWGVSGTATAGKGRCLTAPTGRVDVRGAHFTNAGDNRGVVGRRGVEPLHYTDQVEPAELAAARINPVNNGAVIGDCLTTWNAENYLRFEHVGAVLNDISHEFVKAARIVKFEPDGLTEGALLDMCRDICDARVQSGALVTPRNPEDGDEPYQIMIEQVELDLWQVTIAVCVTGVGRRIAMQPILIK
ncbi:hypothetical protein [Endozoicomonas lisbonensis]|uniref:Tail sheath protein subtilisin-like domain-containing protein n=1 Tax=Endozoicomonas lisbonensis TaxID=3120522 RepID=A0ABV2SR35_9GAMM